ncbi:BatA domain-containing protein [Planctomicrobium sp.]|nr:BatA domain-containing protein [Planctomicrobium sp.]
MTFLQPLLLFALPLIALPILIHLINQNRHKTIKWAATMFLLQAKRMSKGMARLRYLLIMLMRMLAIAGLIFAISRPMAGGWLGFTAGSTPDTTIIVLDRSASMQEQGAGSTQSKRETALQKLSDLIQNTGRNTQLVLFESTSSEPKVIGSAAELNELPETGPSATAADIPSLLEQVTEYIVTNETGRTDVWICSDLRQSDWNPSGGRWQTIQKQLTDREGTRLYLLNYANVADDNLSVRVSGVHRRESAAGAELVMDITLTRSSPLEETHVIPVNIVLNGARTTLEVEMTSSEVVRNGHTIPIASESKSGWGRVELPGDANPADNIFRFVYSEPAAQKTVIVSDDDEMSELLEIVAANGVDNSLTYSVETVGVNAAATLPWKEAGLILWHAPLPTDVLAKQVEDFVQSGRTVIFFPPESPDETSFMEVSWGDWINQQQDTLTVQRWRTDSGLLSNTLSGSPLPVGQIEVSQYCSLNHSESTLLAQFAESVPVLLRRSAEQGAVYFCSTLPVSSHSNLTKNGIVLYIMIHRALARGAAALGSAQQHAAGQVSNQVAADWRPLDELSADELLSQRGINPGLYTDDEDIVHAINRPESEDTAIIVDDESLATALNGVNYTKINDEAGSAMALASEVWRTFLIIMIGALLLEALLCIPDRQEIPKVAMASNTNS